MSGFANKDGRVIVDKLITAIQTNKEYLSDIDGLIGDGDHGINMNKGFTMCQERLEADMDLTTALKTLSGVLMEEIGGSMGPLYGTFFRKMSRASKGQEIITRDVFCKMLADARTGVQELGSAKVGDKTLMDVLIPADEAYQAAVKADKDFKGCLEDMKAAADKGWQSTKDLVAKIGRASRLGERSRGVLDAGATSCNLLLQTMADAIIELI